MKYDMQYLKDITLNIFSLFDYKTREKNNNKKILVQAATCLEVFIKTKLFV